MKCRNRFSSIVAVALLSFVLGPQAPAQQAQLIISDEVGTLPDGTKYEIRVPENWNGVLINDLDFAMFPELPMYKYWVTHGYALSGTVRRYFEANPLPVDPVREIHDLMVVLDVFQAKRGKPKFTIQHGCSVAGYYALLMGELYPSRIDGVVATGAANVIWEMNTELDGWFALQQLVAPNLDVSNPTGIMGSAEDLAAGERWKAAITEAQKTPLGRARIALATTVGQLPEWIGPSPRPNPGDAHAMQAGMYEAFLYRSRAPGGLSRYLFSKSAGGGQLSSNVGVDYKKLFAQGDENEKKIVRQLYREANASLEGDLATINKGPRIAADPKAVRWWSMPGRLLEGKPKVPTVRLHSSGDWAVPISTVEGYDRLVEQNGFGYNFRSVFVDRAGHCTYSPAEMAVAVDTVVKRLDTGKWGSTQPQALNALAGSLDPTSDAHFFDYKQNRYHHVWLPTAKDLVEP